MDVENDTGALEKIPFNVFQKELWLGCQTSLTDYAETSTRGVFRVAENIEPAILRQAVGVVLRHMPILGATLGMDGDEPCFVAGAPHDIDLRALDLRGDADSEEAARRFATSFLDEPVDERFVRYAVLRMADDECVFLFKCSHLALDGLGYFFHVSFLTEVYTALRRGESLDLGEPCSLREQNESDAAYRTSARAQKDLDFWRGHLERLPERRIFRALPGRPDVLGNSRHKRFTLSEETSLEIADILTKRGVGPAAYFTALHALIVAYMCDEKGLVIQTPIAFGERKSNRRRQGVRMATPSLFLEMRQYESFGQLLEAIGKQSAEFFRHVRTPFQLAMRQLPDKHLPHIADTFMNYLPGRPLGTPEFPIVWIDQNHSEKEPVLLGALVMEDCLTRRYVLLVRSSRNHLSERDVERYVKRIGHLTHQLAAGADLPDLDCMLDEEKRELAAWVRGENRPDHVVASMPALFDAKAELFADRIAVRDEDGLRLTYAELRANSLRRAARLAARGVGPGDVVAVLAQRTPHLPEIVLGIQRLSAVYLPVDPKAPADRVDYILADAGAALTLDATEPCDGDAAVPDAGAFAGPRPGDAAYLIYTSGSTGRPKGVLAPHGGFVNMIQGQIEVFGVGPEDHVLQFAPPVFDASLSEMFMALFAGAALYPVRDELRNAPWALKTYMAENGVSVVTFPPSYLRLFDREPFPGLRVLITAGEPPVAKDALHYAGELRYFNAYGPTETCVCASMKRVAPDEPLPISSGRPIPNAAARILDSEGRERPAGMVGELWVGGPGVALGYRNNPEMTARRFRPLPGGGERAYATGDQALWSDQGEIILVGRADDQVKIRGNRVELGEVTFLLERCESVRQAAVLVTRDAANQPALAAFLLLRPGATLDSVAAWSRTNLPAYMLPSTWRVLAAMPVTRTGKIDREALTRLAGKPEPCGKDATPADPRLLELCGRVLGRAYDPSANFFDQGGNSLLAMTLLHEIRKTFGVGVVFRDFVTCETLRDLQTLLRGHAETSTATQCDKAPLTRSQFRIWAYQQANTGAIDYNMPLLLEARGPDAEGFATALRRAVEEQELLACVVAGDIDRPRFVKTDAAALHMPVSPAPNEAAAMAFFDWLIHTPFDLRRERPVRLAEVRVGERVLLLLLIHHIAGDGETLDLLLKNALEIMDGGSPAGGTLAAQAGACRREAEYLDSEDGRADAEYWRGLLTPPISSVNPAARHGGRKGAMTALPVPPAALAGLDRLTKASGATPPACFAALLARFLCRRYDREEMLVGLPVGLRETGEEFRSAGFFVNTVALRLPAAGDVVATARTAAEQLRAAVTHSRYCDIPAVPDFLATHSSTARIGRPGLALRRLAPTLRAAKLTGSLTLETGAEPCLTLEYDAGFIPDGSAFLNELLRYMERECAEVGEADAANAPETMTDASEDAAANPRPEERSDTPERSLARAWEEILRAEPNEGDDFLRAGGDSIKAIQITGILRRAGVTALTAPDFLRTPSYAELRARLAGGGETTDDAAPHVAVLPGQVAPLSPIQHELLRRHPEHWRTFLMPLALRLANDVAPEAIADWLRTLPEHHEALGLAFFPLGAVMLARRNPIALAQREFASTTPDADLLRAMVREIAAKLEPAAGRTLGAGLARRGGETILVLVGHHLVLDAVSLDLLRRDLLRHLRRERPGREACGPASLALTMRRLADTGEFPTADDARFWEVVRRTPSGPLAALNPNVGDRAAERTVERARLAGFRPDFSPSVTADLLCALCAALHAMGQRETVFATLESHGRDALPGGPDLSGSLGWFTAVCPAPLAPAATCAEAGRSLRPWLRRAFTPRDCNAYGLLRVADPDRFGFDSQIGFNYLGELAAEDGRNDAVTPLPPVGPWDVPELLHPDFEPDSPLELAAFFDAVGELHLLASFSPAKLPAQWAAGLLAAWTGALRTLPAYRRTSETDETGASDDLAAILAACGCEAGDVERIEEPWPGHEAMLFQHLRSDDGVYTQQIEFDFEGDIDDFALMRAWNAVADRHESLRTLFPMPHDGEFHRVALRRGRTEAEYHDLSHLPADTARAEAGELWDAQRAKRFALGRGPLLRAQFLRMTPRTLALRWCFHHLLMDGWCTGVLLDELAAAYAGQPLPAPFPLARYERWRARFDEDAALDYWTGLLKGFTPITGVTPPGVTRGTENAAPQTLEFQLDADQSAALAAAATAHSATLSVLSQALWAMILGAENDTARDVVFGVVVSGRPAELPDVDRAIGLFIQTLPVRARWTLDDGLGDLLADLREQSLGQMRHGYLPLARIGRNLLDHLMVFENYPFTKPFGDSGPQLVGVHGHEELPYPLGVTIVPGERLLTRLLYDPAVITPERATDLGDRLRAVMLAVAARPDVSCRELEAVAAAHTRSPAIRKPSPAPSPESPAIATTSGATGNDDTERIVREVYATVLGQPLPAADTDFFLLGGHSLSAMRVMAQLAKRLGVRLGVDDILNNPSPRELAARIHAMNAPAARIPRVDPGGTHPLSPAQRRIWFLQRLHNDDRVYQIPFAARLRGPIDVEALSRALHLLETRHDALRLRVSGTAPEQRLAEPGGLTLEIHDGPCPELTRGVQPMPFGFDRSLVRVELCREDDEDSVLFVSVHHIMFDGWSAQIFLRELNQAYAAELRGVAPDWPALELDYLSYAEWEGHAGSTGDQTGHLDELKRDLLPLPERPRLPLDFPRPAGPSLAGGVAVLRLGAERGRRLKEFAHHAGTSLFPVLVALVDAFLLRHTGQTDVIVGSPTANREQSQTEQMIGLFVNTLVMRARMDPERGFADLVRTADAALTRALASQSLPFEKLVEALGAERDLTRNPLFDVFVALENADWLDYDRPPLHMRPIGLPHDRSKFDLSFYFREIEPDVFDLHLEYRADLFREETAHAMCARMATLLDGALDRPDAPLAELPVMPGAELALLRGYNETSIPFDLARDADARFRAQANAMPGAPAILDPSGRTVGYARFDILVSAMAARLAGRGVAPGNNVVVCFERSLDMMVCVFAIMRLGAVYAPLAPDTPDERLRAILEDLGDCVVVCAPGFAAKFAASGRPVVTVENADTATPAEAVTWSAAPIGPDALAYIIFTSGSTGRPKGVRIERRALVNRLAWMQELFPIGPDDVVLQKTTTTFDVSIWELFWWSWTGASLTLLEPGAEGDPARIVTAVSERRVTVLHFVPSMLRAFLDYLDVWPEEVRKLGSLRHVFTSGEALPRELVVRFNALLRARLHNLYGPTEATVDVTWQPCTPTPANVVPIGRPVANTALFVLDAHGHPTPPGVAGELWIAGAQVARGYVNRPELTAERFVPVPAELAALTNAPTAGRMYRTGDLGRWLPDGSIEYWGRNDDQIKVRGHRIELGEVEAALARCSDVAQAVARSCRIGGLEALEAFVLPRSGPVPGLRALRAELAAILPDYMIPARFFIVDEMPLTPSGKADRKRVTGTPLAVENGAKPAGGRERGQDTGPEEEVRAVWRAVMPEVEDIDPDLGFFEAGGNSLLLVRLHALLEERWPGMFTLAGLFSESSIRAQARFIERAEGRRARPGTAASASEGPVAVIGMAVRLGDDEGVGEFWADLAAGADKNVPLPKARRREVRQIFEAAGHTYDESRLREAAYLSEISGFDAKRFGLAPGDAALLDPAQRLFLETALRALDDAGYGGAALLGTNVGTFVGASPCRLFQDAATRAFPDQAERIYLLNVPSNVVARLSHLKDWHGPAAAIDTACSSALTATHAACRCLRQGECDVAVVGAAHIIDMPVKAEAAFAIEATDGRTRTFDAGAAGVGAGEGAAVFVLKRLSDATRDHDAIHAVIAGSAVNQDGRASSMAAPNPKAQAAVIAAAARDAGVALTDMSFFEAHGTATVLGDPVEIEGLRQAFALENADQGATQRRKAPIGSVKGNLGHLDAAAGAVGLAKAVLCLEHGLVPPQPHFTRANPHIDFDAAPVRVVQTLEPLPPEARPWRCGVSSFGLSGVNAHVVVREHAPATPPPDDGAWFCVPLSARDEAGLDECRHSLRDTLAANESWPLHAVAATLTTGRDVLEVRAAIVAHSRQELLDALLDGEGTRHTASDHAEGADKTQAVHATRAGAEAAARAFLAGAELVWPRERPVFRLHLPATPLRRDTLWPRFAERYVSGPVRTPAGEAHEVAIGRPDFWPVAEHKLNGAPTLVGMCLSDLIGAVAGPPPLRIDDIRWRKPVILAPGSRATLLMEKRDGARSIVLQHFDGGAWSPAASAVLRTDAPDMATRPAPLDLPALRAAMRPVDPERGPADSGPVSVGGRWDCRAELRVDDAGDKLLARIVLPAEFRHDLDTFKWHPAMADVAASLALRGTEGYVPAGCGTARLFRPLPASFNALATVTRREPGLITARCVMADPAGNVLAELNDLTFLALRPTTSDKHPETPSEASSETSAPRLYGLKWEPLDRSKATAERAGTILLLGRSDGAIHNVLAPRARLSRALPADEPGRRELAGEIARAGIDHIVYLPAPGDAPWSLCDLLRELCRTASRRRLRVTAVIDGGPEQALTLGPLLCLPQEEPLVSCACALIEADAPKAAETLAATLGHIDGQYRVDADGTPRAPRFVPLTDATAGVAATLPQDGCVVITGGLGGMGRTLARRIAAETGARPVLLHRGAGTPVDIPFACRRCDVTDAGQVARTLADIRREMGPIQGVIHCAGVAGDGYLAGKSREVYEAVLAPKVAGTRNLHEATLDDDLRFFALASSRTALTGAPGQSDYTAANAFLNAFARRRHEMGLPATAICWNT